MDIEFWDAQWSAAQQSSSLSEGYKRSDNWEAFWGQYAKRYAMENRDRFSFFSSIVDHLDYEGVIPASCNVLDIGCGPGTFSIPLALKGVNVTGLDTAAGMLAVMKEEAVHYNVTERIKALEQSWELLPENGHYDLVMGANTPAIKDYNSLMKMSRLSNRYCCLISFAGSYQSVLRRDLWFRIMGAPLESKAFDVQYPFNILYLKGDYPNIRFFPYHWDSTRNVDEVIDHYLHYFSLFGKQGKSVEDEILKFLDSRQTNGLVSDSQEGVMAVIWWKIKPDN